MEAITSAYCENRNTALLVGSVKTNLGHSEPASGMASIAKTLITFENRLIPASLHLEKANPNIPALVSGVIRPVTENTEFTDSIVAIDSFGFGGANAHILLRPNTNEPNVDNNRIVAEIPRIIPLFGRTVEAVNHLADFIENNDDKITRDFLSLLNDVKDTSGMNYRSFIMTKSGLNNESSRNFVESSIVEQNPTSRPLWFLFSGNLNGNYNSNYFKYENIFN